MSIKPAAIDWGRDANVDRSLAERTGGRRLFVSNGADLETQLWRVGCGSRARHGGRGGRGGRRSDGGVPRLVSSRAAETRPRDGGSFDLLALYLALVRQFGVRATAPTQPVRIIVQTGPGASIDLAARILGGELSQVWKQPVYISNQPGAGGALAAKALAEAEPDGRTILFAGSGVLVVLPELQPRQAASINSFAPVAFVGDQPMAIVVGADSPIKSLSQLVAEMKTAPDGLNCAVGTRGGFAHLAAEAFASASGAKVQAVFYPGTAQALQDVMAERVPFIVDSLPAFLAPAASGQVRILAIAAATRLKTLPDLPTVAETIPRFDATAWSAFFAPPGTTQSTVDILAAGVDTVLKRPAMVARLEETGTFVRRMSLSDFPIYLTAQRQMWRPTIEKFGAAP